VYAQRLYRHNDHSISLGSLFDLLIAGRDEFYRTLPLWDDENARPSED
jgi:hypothetical protein